MSGLSFNHFLREKNVDTELRSLLYHIARSVKYINFSLRAGNTEQLAVQNIQGEEQMELDVLSDKIIATELKKSELVKLAISEEEENPRNFPAPRGNFIVAYDPLDGSSLINANLSIGSIFGIWNSDKNSIVGLTGGDQVAAAYAVYGPRITLNIAIKGKGVSEFELNDVGEFILTRDQITLKPDTKYFSPGNLRACTTNQKYKELVHQWIDNAKTLRYSGGMVPDIHHMLSKEEGIFSYPSGEKYPQGKLRLSFECVPFSFICEEAQGLALSEDGTRVLDKEIKHIHDRSTIFVGSKNAVQEAVNFLQK